MRTAFAILTLAATACVPAPDPPRADPPAEPDAGKIVAGEPFELRMGEEERLASHDLAVRFAAVAGDSRCPRDVTCIWEGDAEIEVTLTRGDEQAALALHTHGGARYPRQATAFGCTLELKELDPYPVSTEETAPDDYVATLVLTLDE